MLEVKEKLVALTNIPTDRQRLIFRGAVLQDTQGVGSARTPSLSHPFAARLAHPYSQQGLVKGQQTLEY